MIVIIYLFVSLVLKSYQKWLTDTLFEQKQDMSLARIYCRKLTTAAYFMQTEAANYYWISSASSPLCYKSYSGVDKRTWVYMWACNLWREVGNWKEKLLVCLFSVVSFLNLRLGFTCGVKWLSNCIDLLMPEKMLDFAMYIPRIHMKQFCTPGQISVSLHILKLVIDLQLETSLKWLFF